LGLSLKGQRPPAHPDHPACPRLLEQGQGAGGCKEATEDQISVRSCPARCVSPPSYILLPLFPLVSVLAATCGLVYVSCGMNSVLTSTIPISPRCSVRLHQGELYSDWTNGHSVDLLHLPRSLRILARGLLHRGQWRPLWCARRRWVVTGASAGLLQGTHRATCAGTITTSTPRSPGRCLTGSIQGTLVAEEV